MTCAIGFRFSASVSEEQFVLVSHVSFRLLVGPDILQVMERAWCRRILVVKLAIAVHTMVKKGRQLAVLFAQEGGTVSTSSRRVLQ